MRVDNQRVIDLKKSTRSGAHDRGFIQGTLVGQFNGNSQGAERQGKNTGHYHLDVFIGDGSAPSGRDSDIEIVYNDSFGAIQGRLTTGMEVIACGDFINSSQQNGHYSASPVGAIIHWVHMAPRPEHVSGFLMIDGSLYGQTNPHDRGGSQDDRQDAAWNFQPMFGLSALVQ